MTTTAVPKLRNRAELVPAGGLLAGALILVDLLSKTWANNQLSEGREHSWGPFTWQLVHNSGIGFGIPTGGPGLAIAISALGLVLLVILLLRATGSTVRVALAVALAGGVSNLLDRLAQGSVTDWIHVAGYSPTFNLADVAVRGGLLFALIAIARPRRKEPQLGKPAHRTRHENPGP